MSQHRAALTQLVAEQRWTAGAELGVDKGILFGMLLRECPELSLIGVDTFPNRERSRRAFELLDLHSDRCRLLVMTTREASTLVLDRSLDFVFIDADHSEVAVAEDIARWQPKVRKDGWLGGHDYSRKFSGVMRAVDRRFGTSVKQWPGSIWGVWQ